MACDASTLSTLAHFEQQLIGPGGPFELVAAADGRKSYLRGPQNLVGVIRRVSALAAQSQLVADQSHSFAEIARAAAALLHHCPQIRAGTRVAIALPNGVEWLFAFVACAARGAVAILPRVGAELGSDAALEALAGVDYDFIIHDGGALQSIRHDPRTIDIGRVARVVEGAKLFAPMEVDPGAPALIAFTSGSTARPKAIVHSQASVSTGLQNMMLAARLAVAAAPLDTTQPAATRIPARPSVLLLAPFAYVSGFSQLLLAYLTGATIVIDVPGIELLDRIEKFAVSSLVGPTADALERLAAAPDLARRAATLQVVHGYGAEVSARIRQRLMECIPHLSFAHGYGLSETVGPVALTERSDSGSILQLLPTFQAQVRATRNETLETVCGELWLRGNSLMLGYGKGTSIASLDAGWFATGDEVEKLAPTRFRLLGRASRILEKDGSRVSLAQVEARAGELASGSEAAAFASAAASQTIRVAIVGGHDDTVLAQVRLALEAEFRGFPFEPYACSDIPKLHGGKIDYLSLEKRLIAALSAR
jgi:acyl-CoA synthetase (AMP-forming)/AMP-acid ligase II